MINHCEFTLLVEFIFEFSDGTDKVQSVWNKNSLVQITVIAVSFVLLFILGYCILRNETKRNENLYQFHEKKKI